jgi:hypothetical protein
VEEGRHWEGLEGCEAGTERALRGDGSCQEPAHPSVPAPPKPTRNFESANTSSTWHASTLATARAVSSASRAAACSKERPGDAVSQRRERGRLAHRRICRPT